MNIKEIVEHWNFYYPPGTEVQLTNDLGEVEKTKTRSEAWLLGSGHPVVSVEGRTGGYLLDRIRPVRAFSPEDICKGIYPAKVKVITTCGSCGQVFTCVLDCTGLHTIETSKEYDQYVRDRKVHASSCQGFQGMGNHWSSV